MTLISGAFHGGFMDKQHRSRTGSACELSGQNKERIAVKVIVVFETG
jgi:hypothetical protein